MSRIGDACTRSVSKKDGPEDKQVKKREEEMGGHKEGEGEPRGLLSGPRKTMSAIKAEK